MTGKLSFCSKFRVYQLGITQEETDSYTGQDEPKDAAGQVVNTVSRMLLRLFMETRK